MEIISNNIRKSLNVFIVLSLTFVAFCQVASATVLPITAEFIKKVTGDVIVKSPNEPVTFTVRVIDNNNQPINDNEVNYSLVCDKKVKSSFASKSDEKGFSSWITKINQKGECVVYAKIANGSTVEFKVKAAEVAPPWLPDKIVFILALLTSILTALLIAREYLFGMLIFGKNKKRMWGVVYDSQSGATIDHAMVELYDAHSDRLISKTFSNNQGKYGFSVQSGDFYMKIISQSFDRLDKNYDKNKIELKYNNNYFGDVFSVSDKNRDSIILNQPLAANIDFSRRLLNIKFRTRLLEVLGVCLWFFLISGTILSILALLYSNTTINFIIIGIYLLLWIFLLRNTAAPKVHVFVRDSDSKKPLSDILIQFFSDDQKIIRSMVSDRSGEFQTLIPKGNYQIYCLGGQYILAESIRFNLTKRINKMSIELKKNSSSESGIGDRSENRQKEIKNIGSSDEIIQKYRGNIGR